jgi:hypothetical protein
MVVVVVSARGKLQEGAEGKMMLKIWVKRLVLLGTILAALLVLTGCTGGGGLAHLWGEIIVDGQPFLGPVPITVTTGDGQVRQEIFTEGRYEFRDLPAGTVVLETEFFPSPGRRLWERKEWSPLKSGTTVFNLEWWYCPAALRSAT